MNRFLVLSTLTLASLGLAATQASAILPCPKCPGHSGFYLHVATGLKNGCSCPSAPAFNPTLSPCSAGGTGNGGWVRYNGDEFYGNPRPQWYLEYPCAGEWYNRGVHPWTYFGADASAYGCGGQQDVSQRPYYWYSK